MAIAVQYGNVRRLKEERHGDQRADDAGQGVVLWLTPRMPPCLAGSLRRLISDCSDGVISEKPVTSTADATTSSQAARLAGQTEQHKAEHRHHAAGRGHRDLADPPGQPPHEQSLGQAEREADEGKVQQHLRRT